MLRQVEVKEIVVGVSDILNILAWFWDCWRISQHRYQNNAVFMDNEEVSIPLNDVYRMAGFIDCPDPVPSAEEPELELYSRMTKENRWRQLPAKIMIGDRITDTLIVILDFERNESKDYLIQQMRVQEKLFQSMVEVDIVDNIQ